VITLSVVMVIWMNTEHGHELGFYVLVWLKWVGYLIILNYT